jgi:hypothetical protein
MEDPKYNHRRAITFKAAIEMFDQSRNANTMLYIAKLMLDPDNPYVKHSGSLARDIMFAQLLNCDEICKKESVIEKIRMIMPNENHVVDHMIKIYQELDDKCAGYVDSFDKVEFKMSN